MRILGLKSLALTFLMISVVALASKAQAPQASEKAASKTPLLLELFTSEGCSSCPPADALLRELNGTTSSGRLLIVLSEHVTYWNRLGWSDPFSADTFTNRQNAYGERFHLDSVYTPQLVVNGASEVVGSNRGEVAAAIAAQHPAPAKLAVHILSAHEVDGKVAVAYSVLPLLPVGGAELFAVVADDMDETKVLRGENGGRTLSHVAVARSLIHLGPLQKATESGQLTIPLQTNGAAKRGPQHLVLFAQSPGLGPVLSVDALPITRP